MEAREENGPQEHNEVLRTTCILESNTPSEEVRPQPSGQTQYGPSDRSQPGPFDITQPGLSGQPENSRQPQPGPCSSMTHCQSALQQDVPKCVYCDRELETFDTLLDEEKVRKIPDLCPNHFSMGVPDKKYLKEPQDPTKICLVCTIYFRVVTQLCHFTDCDPGQHDDPYCEICVKSMEEAERLEHVSPSGTRNLHQADDEGDDPKTSGG